MTTTTTTTPSDLATHDGSLGHQIDHAAWNIIDTLDFTLLKSKLCHEEGEGWAPDWADRTITKYKRWLYLILKNPTIRLVPSKHIDTVWHHHILDTNAYLRDCNHVFGYFLHHFPYYGLRGDADADSLNQSFLRTMQMYRETWLEEMTFDASAVCSDGQGNCDHSPK